MSVLEAIEHHGLSIGERHPLTDSERLRCKRNREHPRVRTLQPVDTNDRLLCNNEYPRYATMKPFNVRVVYRHGDLASADLKNGRASAFRRPQPSKRTVRRLEIRSFNPECIVCTRRTERVSYIQIAVISTGSRIHDHPLVAVLDRHMSQVGVLV